MDTWLILLSSAIGCVTFYIWYNMTYFKRHGIPYKTPWPIIGNMGAVLLRREHFITNISSYYNSFPDAKYFGYFDTVYPTLIIRDPELIKLIAVKHFDNFPDHKTFVNEEVDPLFGKSLFGLRGDRWREVRSLLSPAFTASKMRQMSDLMGSCAKSFTSFLLEKAKGSERDFEMKDAFTKYTNDVIATCAFGIQVNTMQDPTNDFYVYGKEVINLGGWKVLKVFLARFCPKLAKMLKMQVFDQKVANFFMDIVRETIETRKEKGISRPDMIQLMMESQEKSNGVQMDLLDMTAQAFLFFFGGFDSSSQLMNFTALMLALYPEVQDKVVEEVDEVMKQTKGNPNYEEIQGMVYLEAVLYETLRYFPIAGATDRLCQTSFELPPALPGLKPFVVKPGMSIWFPTQAIHEDPQYYENPKKFDPDRFLGQKMTANSPTYLAFGIGPRACIGNRFALLETKQVIFQLLTRCRFEKSPKLKEPIEFVKSSMSILIEGGSWIRIVPRD